MSCSSALKLGGNMSAIMTNISFMENNSQFVIHSVTDTLTMKGHFNLYNNKGSIFISESSELVFSQATVKFINNTIEGKAPLDTVVAVQNSKLTLSDSSVSFINNHGTNCGGISARNTIISLNGKGIISFIGNDGEISGALLFYSSSMSSDHNSSSLLLYENRGPAMVCSSSQLLFAKTNVIIVNNTAYRSDVFVEMSTVVVTSGSSITFDNSTIRFISNQAQQCGGIMVAKNSVISFVNHSNAFFFRNLGELGGAISLSSMSILSIDHGKSNITLTFFENEARKGGAIFVDDSTYMYAYKLQVSAIQKVGASTHLSFSDNVALLGGSNIYGGWIDWSVSNGNYVFTTDIWNNTPRWPH